MPSRDASAAADGGTSSSSRHSLPPLDPPSFDVLPPDFWSDRSRYKLLSIRAPVGFDPSSLDGRTIELDEEALFGGNGGSAGAAAATVLANFEGPDGTALCLTAGHRSESDGFRLLVPSGGGGKKNKRKRGDDDDDNEDDDDEGSESDDDSGVEGEDEDEEEGKAMRPLPAPFDAHLNVSDLSGFDAPGALDLAPGLHGAPEPSADARVRVAYSVVPQREGLKRRWTMPGGRAGRVGTTTKSTPTSGAVAFQAAATTRVKKEDAKGAGGERGAPSKEKTKRKVDEKDTSTKAANDGEGRVVVKKEKKSAKKKHRHEKRKRKSSG